MSSAIKSVDEDIEPSALREEVRRAVVQTRKLRFAVWFSRSLFAWASLGFLYVDVSAGPFVYQILWVLFIGFPVSGLISAMVALPVAAGYRRMRQRRFRTLVEALPPAESVRALRGLEPLESDRVEDMRKLVAPLMRELDRTTEIIPVRSPAGGGDELSPSVLPTVGPKPPGPGIGRHRQWELKSPVTSFWDRFK